MGLTGENRKLIAAAAGAPILESPLGVATIESPRIPIGRVSKSGETGFGKVSQRATIDSVRSSDKLPDNSTSVGRE